MLDSRMLHSTVRQGYPACVARKDESQVNIRVKSETLELLEAAVYLRRLRGMQALLLPVIEQFVEDLLREDPEIQAAVRARRERDARHAGKLRRISRKKQAGNGA